MTVTTTTVADIDAFLAEIEAGLHAPTAEQEAAWAREEARLEAITAKRCNINALIADADTAVKYGDRRAYRDADAALWVAYAALRSLLDN